MYVCMRWEDIYVGSVRKGVIWKIIRIYVYVKREQNGQIAPYNTVLVHAFDS